jgi:hypothetical protein
MTTNQDPDELRMQIEHTRDELAATVQALAEKADVKGRAAVKAHEVAGRARERALQAKQAAIAESQVAREQIGRTQAEMPWLLPSAGGIAMVSLIIWYVVRRRHS